MDCNGDRLGRPETAKHEPKVKEALEHLLMERRERRQTFGLVLDTFEGLEDEVGGRRMRRVTLRGAGPGKPLGRPRGLGSLTVRLSSGYTVLIWFVSLDFSATAS